MERTLLVPGTHPECIEMAPADHALREAWAAPPPATDLAA